MKVIKFMVSALSLLAVLSFVFWDTARAKAPGPLHGSHANVPDLAGSAGCVKCHGETSQDMNRACLSCHEPIAEQMQRKRGLHGDEKATGQSCSVCHVEHTNMVVALVSEKTFRLAGVTHRDAYDHGHVHDWNLTGKHTEASCSECHPNAHADSLARGEKRFLGLALACQSCHDDPHRGDFGKDCASCHGQQHAFKEVAEFGHTGLFPLEGGHADRTCQACHAEGGVHSVGQLLQARNALDDALEAGLATSRMLAARPSEKSTPKPERNPPQRRKVDRQPGAPVVAAGDRDVRKNRPLNQDAEQADPALPVDPALVAMKVRACVDCHDSPHRNGFVELAVKLSKREVADTCTLCHRSEHESFVGPTVEMTKSRHAATGFKLDKPHDQQDCQACHAEFGKRKPLDEGPRFRAEFRKLFPGRQQSDCAACHKDPHAGQFDRSFSKGRCITCHASSHFMPAAFGIAEHSKSRFPLTGAHGAVSCDRCHDKATAVADQNQGPEKWAAPAAAGEPVRRFVPTPTACAACHKDVHQGRFDMPDKPSKIRGKVGCARCHDTASFNEVKWTAADHALWTGYALKGSHAKATCAQCHKPKPQRRALQAGPVARADVKDVVFISTFAVASTECASCHADPHLGQFRLRGTNDCSRCHTDTSSFKKTVFDHNKHARFKLDSTHGKVACAECHKSITLRSGLSVVRYVPLGRRCQDCHGSRDVRRKERR